MSRQDFSPSFSPRSQGTPQLMLTEAEGYEDGEEEEGSTMTVSESEDDDEAEDEDSKTPAQRLAAKRKAKRFRLTHSQTRFLMSEFSRQAHPDAAHRERLSRDIPGLSPRQVQVWFQNRRAKLKRLPSDDQERVTKSRALPDNFDFSQTLRDNLRQHQQPQPTSAQSLNAGLFGGGTNRKTAGGPRDARNVPPLNMASVLGHNSQGATDSANLSEVKSVHEGSQHSASQSPIIKTPQSATIFEHPSSLRANPNPQIRHTTISAQEGTLRPRASSHVPHSSPATPITGEWSSLQDQTFALHVPELISHDNQISQFVTTHDDMGSLPQQLGEPLAGDMYSFPTSSNMGPFNRSNALHPAMPNQGLLYHPDQVQWATGQMGPGGFYPNTESPTGQISQPFQAQTLPQNATFNAFNQNVYVGNGVYQEGTTDPGESELMGGMGCNDQSSPLYSTEEAALRLDVEAGSESGRRRRILRNEERDYHGGPP